MSKMYIADTNIFLRFLVKDVPKHAEEAKRLVALAAQREITLVLPTIVIFELVFVLTGKQYNLDVDRTCYTLQRLINATGIEVEEKKSSSMHWSYKSNIQRLIFQIATLPPKEKCLAQKSSLLTMETLLSWANLTSCLMKSNKSYIGLENLASPSLWRRRSLSCPYAHKKVLYFLIR